MRGTPEDSRRTGLKFDANSGFAMPPVSSTTFTAPAYNASTDRNKTGLWARVCFVCGTLFGFRGRIGRLDYWVIGTAYSFTSVVGYYAFGQEAGSLNFADISAVNHDPGFVLRFFTFCFVMMMLRLSLEARRFQDRGLSGYWYFGYLVPFLNLYLLLANSVLPGTKGPNDYDL